MARLRIGIDGYNLAMPNGTGIASYGYTLAHTLAAAGHQPEGLFGIDAGRDPALREVLFFDRLAVQPELKLKQRQARARRWERAALWPWTQRRAEEVPLTGRVEKATFADRLPPFARITSAPDLFEIAHRHFRRYGRFVTVTMVDPPPIMHWTYPVPVTLAGAANLYTQHDLVPLKLPYTTLDGKAAYRRLVAACIAHSARICTVSEASRADIVAEFDLDPARVVNTYQAAPPAPPLDRTDDAAALEGIFGLKPQGYFLYFGAVEPKKNIGRLLEAFLSLNGTTPLVMVGGRGWRAEEELALLPPEDEEETGHGRRLAERLIRTGHLPRPLLQRLIRNARAVIFPSIYEGFGLPVLEALQQGVPVLTSAAGSLPEVAGDAALLVDPYDVGAIRRGLEALDRDADLRARLAAAGPVQAQRFTGDAYLARLEALYRPLLHQGG